MSISITNSIVNCIGLSLNDDLSMTSSAVNLNNLTTSYNISADNSVVNFDLCSIAFDKLSIINNSTVNENSSVQVT